MTATPQQLQAVLTAALDLLGARQDQMITIQDWLALAQAVAVATGRRRVDLLTDRDLEYLGPGASPLPR